LNIERCAGELTEQLCDWTETNQAEQSWSLLIATEYGSGAPMHSTCR
jgi:hypothetical protein